MRRGAVLLVVAGVAAMLAALCVAFLQRMRVDADEMRGAVQEAQARIMLDAACMYVQEASRIGWDDPTTTAHEEAAGWIDVRDGRLGPKFRGDGVDDDHRFPVGHAARCPMHVLTLPPDAIELTVAYNPIRTPYSPNPAQPGDPAYGRPFLANPDPQPKSGNNWPGAIDATAFARYHDGDRRPRSDSTGLAWFRVLRDGPATFVVTCGAGATLGYRDWEDVIADGATAAFGDDERRFDELRAGECLRWYRIAWSAAVTPSDYHLLDNGMIDAPDHFVLWPQNCSHYSMPRRGPGHHCNMGGTIPWIERLREAPTRW